MNDPYEISEISIGEQGFYMPPEWHPHTATWVAWPHNRETWPNNLLEVQHEFLNFIAAIAEDEPVMMLCSGEHLDEFLTVVNQRTSKLTNVHVVDIPTNDAWARDYAPTFVINPETNELIGVDWIYNAWGGKYPPFDLDRAAAARICKHIVQNKDLFDCTCTHYPCNFCIEGGALEMAFEKVVLTTKSCALATNRNRTATMAGTERIFEDHLGASHCIWLQGDAITGDDTDGHIDQLARFTPNRSILYAWCEEELDPQFPDLSQNKEDLESGLKHLGLEIDTIPLPIPRPIQLFGQRLPASYCNFYITNKKVIVPQFDQAAADQAAIRIIAEQFPNHETIGLPSNNIAYGQGSFHCLTQQQPAVRA